MKLVAVKEMERWNIMNKRIRKRKGMRHKQREESKK